MRHLGFPWHLLATLVVLLALLPVAAAAQQPEPRLSRWDIGVWPEYDQPSVLVIYNGILAEDTSLPVTLRVPLPPGANVHAVAYKGENDGLFSVPWRMEDQAVVFDMDRPEFFVEYYADVISPPPNRSFELPLAAPYEADQAQLTLRQPSRASDLQVTPALAASGVDELGNPQLSQALGPLTAGQQIPLSVGYVKADADPSVTPPPAAPPAAAQEPAAATSPAWVPWVIGAAVGALIVAAIAWVVTQTRRNKAQTRQARRRAERERAAHRGAPAPAAASDRSATADHSGANKFCPNCGQRYEQGDKFCRNCGAARR